MTVSMRKTEARRIVGDRHISIRTALLAALICIACPSPILAQASPTVARSASAPEDSVEGLPTRQSTAIDDQAAGVQGRAPGPMPGQQLIQTATAAQMPPGPAAGKPDAPAHDLSPLGMFLSADPVVQGVMVLLALASVVTWTILLMKAVGLFLAKRRMRIDLDAIRAAAGLEEASKRVSRGVGARLLIEAEEELGLSHGLPSEGIKERVAIALVRIETAVAKRMAVGTGILATVGSVGPFVGLFGTVWGIMRSFIGIANANTTNLAVVAPGIAEALLATGIGLVAAIPAVVIYNALTRSITAYRVLTGDAVALVIRHLSRDLDRRALASHGPKAVIRIAAE